MKTSLILWGALSLAALASADEAAWRSQATLRVPGSGLSEAVLPAGLHFRSGDHFDLALDDGDGEPVPFELYWREDTGGSVRRLEPTSVTLDVKRGYTWEATLPKDLSLKELHIQARAGAGVGTLDLDVKQGGGWQHLASGIALTDNGDGPYASIVLNSGSAVRLHFQGYQEGFKKSIAPLAWVEAEGKPTRVDFVRGWTALSIQEHDKGVYRLLLPGIGLEASRLRLRGQAPYLGAWTLATLDARRGQRVIAQGRTAGLSRKPLQLDIDLGGDLQARALQLTLDAKAAEPFALTEVSLETRLPRLVFHASHGGAYRLRTGLGQRVQALESPNDDKRSIDQRVSVGTVERNPAWTPQALLGSSPLVGAPFNDDGYAWSASVSVPGPGSYRLPLNQAAALDPARAALRLVQGGQQVPYVWAEGAEEASTSLTVQESYDAKANESRYTLNLPQDSSQWKALRVQAHGSFKRLVRLEQPKPGRVGFDVVQQRSWVQGGASAQPLSLGLESLHVGVTQLRLTIAHGDNQRIAVDKVEAVYDAPALLFVASKAGTLQLYGGNASVVAPDYDLGFFDELLGLEDPAPLSLGALKPYAGQSLWQRLQERFQHKEAGLYLVLALVTLGLLVLIVKILPKAEV